MTIQIAGTSGNHCVERAISTMRLALGYETGLPPNWPMDIIKTQMIISQLSSIAFPFHQVKVWHTVDKKHKVGANVEEMGDILVEDFPVDDYLMAFAYRRDGEAKNAHMVIGCPVTYEKILLTLTLAVKL